jgi:hypothetical protein
MSPAILWGLGAGIPAVLLEYLYRTLPGPWWSNWWAWVPLGALIQYSIYRLVTVPGTTLLDALVVFAGCTALGRVAVTFMLGDTVRPGTWAAFGLVMLANVVRAYWR